MNNQKPINVLNLESHCDTVQFHDHTKDDVINIPYFCEFYY